MRSLTNNFRNFPAKRRPKRLFLSWLWVSAIAVTIWMGKVQSGELPSLPSQLGRENLQQAQTYLLEGNLKRASELLQKARQEAESFPEWQPLVEALTGSLFLQQGNYTQAISSYQIAVPLLEGTSQLVALNNLTEAYRRRAHFFRYQARADLDRREELGQKANADEQKALKTAKWAQTLTGKPLSIMRARVNEAVLRGKADPQLTEELRRFPPSPDQIALLASLAPSAPNSQSLWEQVIEECKQLGDKRRLAWAYGKLGKEKIARGQLGKGLACRRCCGCPIRRKGGSRCGIPCLGRRQRSYLGG